MYKISTLVVLLHWIVYIYVQNCYVSHLRTEWSYLLYRLCHETCMVRSGCDWHKMNFAFVVCREFYFMLLTLLCLTLHLLNIAGSLLAFCWQLSVLCFNKSSGAWHSELYTLWMLFLVIIFENKSYICIINARSSNVCFIMFWVF